MPAIHKLDPDIVNKIAAGEVIERPASVLKELLENAIDAGATRIDIAIEDGGAKLVRVTDNGAGIQPDDLPLAVAPHATSKLSTAEDLFNVRSLGFRGEALASIAAVSHLRICTRRADRPEAHEIVSQGGETAPPKPCAAPIGTTVEVRNLFYNVPARRKFLRHASTEHAHATEQLARLALAHPDIAFTATHNGRNTRNLPVTTDRRARIADFYGQELAECLLAIKRDERDLDIQALIAPPANSRTSTKWQYLFLNGRYISDRRIGFAVREAFRGLIENGRFPVVFIFLTTAPDRVDVNVHPTKIEVRWRDAGLVQSQILAALRETLLSHDLTPTLRTTVAYPAADPNEDSHKQATRRALADYLKSVDPTQPRLGFEPSRFDTRNVRPTLAPTFARFDAFKDANPRVRESGEVKPANRGRDDIPSASSGEAPTQPAAAESRLESGQSEQSVDPAADRPTPQPESPAAIQIHNTYLVAQTEEGMLIIDQHALHERILYEKFRTRILAGPLESQRLLIPHTLSVSAEQTRAVERHKDVLDRLGIEIERFGPNAVAVQTFPVLLASLEVETFVSDMLDKLVETGGTESGETLIHGVLDMMACKAAVKAGDPLSSEEIRALLAQRHLVEKSSNCPHGRPTTLQLTTRDLERQFKRT